MMKSGEVAVQNGFTFKWMMSGTTTPEVYGWLEKEWEILKGSAGFYRTPDPEEAAKRAVVSFGIDVSK